MNAHYEINGAQSVLAVERALAELRRGRALYIRAERGVDSEGDMLIAAAETATAALLERLALLAAGTRRGSLALAITGRRAEALGLVRHTASVGTRQPMLLELRRPLQPDVVGALAGVNEWPASAIEADAARAAIAATSQCDAASAAALALAKYAHLLPAVLCIPAPLPMQTDGQLLRVAVADIGGFEQQGSSQVERISEARVPLAGHEDCRLVLFRDARDGSEHVAVVIGTPEPSAAAPVRLHSACLTGDLLGSLRCDCGDQLRTGVDQLAAAGGGVLLYLAQEGRGIGLANKLRAYELQDAGLDTLEADRHLGFRADERSYAVAAGMLRSLGLTRIRLLTNNPDKIRALQAAGIDVVAGERIVGPVNRHNVRYLRAKRERAGHLVPDTRLENLL